MPAMNKSAVVVFLFAASAAHAASFTRNPFTQRVTSTSVIVKWAQASGSATVTYGPKGGATQMVTDAATTSGRHELTLSGLSASTRYAYTVDAGGGTTQSGEFNTAVTASKPFTFIVYGDDRTNDNDHMSVVAAMAKESVDFLVQTGDVCEFCTSAQYDTFFTIEGALLAQNVMFPTLGNHEYGAGVTAWKQQFSVPDTYYTFDYGNSRFVVLDFNENISTQATWLDTALGDAQSKGIQHIFVFLHSSPYDSGDHGENTTAQQQWVPKLQKYGVDMIFGGHDHDYERGYNASTNLRYIVTGGGGAPIYTTNSMNSYQQKFEAVLNYVVVSVSGATFTATAKRIDGSQIDSIAVGMSSTPDMAVAPDLSVGTTGGTGGTGTTGGTSGTTGGTGGTGTTGGTGGTTGGTSGGTSGGGSSGATSGGGTSSSGGCSTSGGGSRGALAPLLLLIGAAWLRSRRRARA
jgi:hypothetical protein